MEYKINIWLCCLTLLLFFSCASTKVTESATKLQSVPDWEAELERAKQAARRSLLKDYLQFDTLSDLHYAAGWGSVALSRHILERDGNIDVRDSNGRTPLFLAAGFNRPEVLDFLLQQGAGLESENQMGSRPIHMAAGFNNNARVLSTLLAAGADVNKANNLGSTPLHWAAGSEALPQSRLLIDSGAQINVRDKQGRTALDVAQDPPRDVSATVQKAEIVFLQEALQR